MVQDVEWIAPSGLHCSYRRNISVVEGSVCRALSRDYPRIAFRSCSFVYPDLAKVIVPLANLTTRALDAYQSSSCYLMTAEDTHRELGCAGSKARCGIGTRS